METVIESKSIPTYIVFLEAEELGLHSVRLPEKIVTDYGEIIPSHGLIKLPNGRHVTFSYEKNGEWLSDVEELINECKAGDCTTIVFSYRSGGNFFVNIFDGMGSETEYAIPKDPSFSVIPQDVAYGVGWKFVSEVDEETINNGILNVPSSFNKRFRKHIPEVVLYCLPCGHLVRGCYCYCSRSQKIYGFLDVPFYMTLNVGDFLMLTNWDAGQFDVVIFDKYGIEKQSPNGTLKDEWEADEEDQS